VDVVAAALVVEVVGVDPRPAVALPATLLISNT
jgi:hypothetical protein